jgi:hypothetical protein
MDLINMLGFRKKQKIPFKVPHQLREFRTKVEAEIRENYPSVDRYREIHEEARSICMYLNGIIANREYAKEAVKIKEDIKKDMTQLARKIKRNMQ